MRLMSCLHRANFPCHFPYHFNFVILIYQMSWCAGFTQSFWDGYNSLIPRDEGFLDRKPLYDAYHQLNHYNLFGGGYIGSARSHLENLKKKLENAK